MRLLMQHCCIAFAEVDLLRRAQLPPGTMLTRRIAARLERVSLPEPRYCSGTLVSSGRIHCEGLDRTISDRLSISKSCYQDAVGSRNAV